MSTEAPRTLTVDVGATGIKVMVLNELGAPISDRQRLKTPRPATTEAVRAMIFELIEGQPAFDRISIGFPGVVIDNKVMTAVNLDGEDWIGYPLGDEVSKRFNLPVRVANDADIQGSGVISGRGVEMVLTLGTGMGSALFIDGKLVPNLELGHHPFRKKKTYEDYVGGAALKKVGKARWSERVRRVLGVIQPIWNCHKIWVGGGNAKKLKQENFPENVTIVSNLAGLLGGIKLWDV